MIVWAIVPVKPLRRGKSRLAPVFSPEERLHINTYLLRHTLSVLQTIPQIENTLVVSRDSEALALARHYNAHTLNEEGDPHLNIALARAAAFARWMNITAVLVLPADLPELEKEDVEALLQHLKNPPLVIIAPDAKEEGTNALLTCPSDIIDYDFGPGSFQRHCQRARQAGARLEIIHRPHLALDLDEPQDIESLRQETRQRLLSAVPQRIND